MGKIGRLHLFVAFAFTVMADPVSSVAYASEAALRGLDGDPASLAPTMTAVVVVVAIVAGTYDQLIRRFPDGGGGPEGVAAAFGDGWAFLPLAALLVDFTLTIGVSTAAAAAAVIAYAPGIADGRLLLALALVGGVGAGVLLGHRGRIGFAIATQAFVILALAVIVVGFGDPAQPAADDGRSPFGDAGFGAALLALPLGMALATGVEAPSNAIAQLPQLADRARAGFGRLTLWLMVAIVGTLTIGLVLLTERLDVIAIGDDSTLLAELARASFGDGAAFGVFQLLSAALLLAAAASSFLAGSGVLKALSRLGADRDGGLLPRRFGLENRFLTAYWGVAALLAVAAAMLIAADGDEQALVPFYAVSVFASFLAATLGCAKLSLADRNYGAFGVNLAGAALVALVLALNLTRLDSAIALAASGLLALALWWRWVRRGRPDHGIVADG